MVNFGQVFNYKKVGYEIHTQKSLEDNLSCCCVKRSNTKKNLSNNFVHPANGFVKYKKVGTRLIQLVMRS